MLPAVAVTICGAYADSPIAVVVHKSNPASNLSVEELRRLYLGRSTEFPAGGHVSLIEYVPTAERFYSHVLDLSRLQYRKYWIGQIFAGAYATPPKPVDELESLREILCKDKTAIAFVPVAELDSCMKVLTINDKAPGDSLYPISIR